METELYYIRPGRNYENAERESMYLKMKELIDPENIMHDYGSINTIAAKITADELEKLSLTGYEFEKATLEVRALGLQAPDETRQEPSTGK